MSSPVLMVEKNAGVACLTLNRPQAMNALSHELRQALTQGFRELAQDDSVRVAILTGAGKAFCAGLDLKELGSRGSQPLGAFTDADMMAAIRGFPGPVIGAVNGFAITGGFELALACDLLIASSEARFADTHARVGILPGWGLSQKLPRLIGIGRAKELSFTGNFIGAEQALAWGLVNRVVAPAELLGACRQLAADMLSCDPASLRGYKQVIDAGFATTFEEGLRLEARVSKEFAKGITPELVATRRGAVQERGRRQTGG
ncbi:MAG TPA: enoyl-CoA hydratase [Myxococcota bacterium]|jgi:enoyl-CoA hydratase